MMMNLFIDIETTGLIPKGADWRTDYNDFPYILSYAFKSGDTIQGEFFLKNDIEIPRKITMINGITQELIDEKGMSPLFIIPIFSRFMCFFDKIIGHNIYFDSSIIKANVLRYFGEAAEATYDINEALHKDKRIDTVRLSQKKLGGKYMSLSDLHFKLFNKKFKAHSALNDVIALEKCYNKLIKMADGKK